MLAALLFTIAAQSDGIIVVGQSLAMGFDSAPALSTTQPYANKIAPLTWAQVAGYWNYVAQPSAWPLVPLVEGVDGGESPRSGMLNTYRKITGRNATVFMGAQGGSPYVSVKKGTSAFNSLTAQIESWGANTPDARCVAAVAIHGENDVNAGTSAVQYEADLVEWQSDIQSLCQRATRTGRATVPMYVVQVSSWTVAPYSLTTCGTVLGQYNAGKDYPSLFKLIAAYGVPYGNVMHHTGANNRLAGELYGSAVALGSSYDTVRPTAVARNGAVITVTFNVPNPPLVLDDVLITDPGNYGFEYTDDSNPPAISSVAISENNVVITLASTPTGANKLIRYAWTGVAGNAPGPTTGPRGCLRDSTATTGQSGATLYLRAPHFQEAVP